jgi:DNA invertase Pin-like site-specific DNA recombinase
VPSGETKIKGNIKMSKKNKPQQRYMALYGRFSSDKQNPLSAEDQLEECKKFIKNRGLDDGTFIIKEYPDEAVTGRHMNRPGIKELLDDIKAKRVAYVIVESLSRITRSLADAATFFEITQFYDVKILTLAEGEIGPIEIAFKGFMNSQFIEDLSIQVRRGKRSNIRNKLSAGSLPFGYDIVFLDSKGKHVPGQRKINKKQAKIVREVYARFLNGESRRSIVTDLNRRGVPTMRGGRWSLVHLCNTKAGLGILRNQIYKGLMIVDKSYSKTHPETKSRVVYWNDPSKYVQAYNPDLEIITEADWRAAQVLLDEAYQDRSRGKGYRARLKLHYKVICKECGADVKHFSHKYLKCSTYNNCGLCNQKWKIRQDVLDEQIIKKIKVKTQRVWDRWMFGLSIQQNVKNYLTALTNNIQQELEEVIDRREDNPVEEEYFNKKIRRIKYKLAKRTKQLEAAARFPEPSAFDYDGFSRFVATADDDDIRELIEEVTVARMPKFRHIYFEGLYPNWQKLLEVSASELRVKFKNPSPDLHLPQINIRGS